MKAIIELQREDKNNGNKIPEERPKTKSKRDLLGADNFQTLYYYEFKRETPFLFSVNLKPAFFIRAKVFKLIFI